MRVLPILFNMDMVRAIPCGRKTATRRPVKYKYSNTEMKMHTDKYGTRLIEIQKDVEGETFGRNEDGTTWHKLRGYVEPKPPYHTGDILYVRETWCFLKCNDCMQKDECFPKVGSDGCCIYRADYGNTEDDSFPPSMFKWHPSIHMPKFAARIWLKVTDVRVERLQDITENQAIKEGISRLYDDFPDDEYEDWTKRTGIYPKQKTEWKYKNYLWHGSFGNYGIGNWKSDGWDYQYSSYENAVGSFSSLWNSTLKKSDIVRYGWDANPWVWVIEFEQCEKPKIDLA